MMKSNPFRELWLKLSRLLQLVTLDNSSLDAVFGSYSDWHKFRPKAAVDAPKPAPPAPATKSNPSRVF